MKLRYPILSLLFFFTVSTAFCQHRTYWQQRVDYTMDINMDAAQHQFTGRQKLIYYNNSPDTLRRVFYHLYFNAFQPGSMMDVRSRHIADPDSRVRDRIYHLSKNEIGYQKINSLKQDGKAVHYDTDGTILEVTLNNPVLPGQKTVFDMNFEAQVPLQIRRSGWNNAEGVELSMSQWYPKISEYDEMGWHPNPYIAREFYGVWGNFDVTIHIDSSYVMGATGYLQNPQEIGDGYEKPGMKVNRPSSDKLTWHWKAEKVHDFMWAADPDFVHTTAQVPDGPMLHFFYQINPVAENASQRSQEQLRKSWEALPQYIMEAFQFMNEHFGKYPYDKFSVIQGGDGGMEYPMATLVTGNRSLPSLVGTTVHEFTHNWFYGVLATNESLYPWIDEGFTTYASALNMNYLFGSQREHPQQNSYASYFSIVKAGKEEAQDTHADHYHTNRAYGVGAYSKGAVFLNQLRYIIGNEPFDRGMKRYFHEWKFKHPNGEDFLRVMEKESGLVLDWYYQYFIRTTKTIDYGITSVVGLASNTYITLERHDLMPMPVDLMVTYTDSSKEVFYMPLRMMRGKKEDNQYPDVKWTQKKDWPWVNPTYTLKIAKPTSSIERIEIDPSQRMADINRENNVMKLNQFTTDSSSK